MDFVTKRAVLSCECYEHIHILKVIELCTVRVKFSFFTDMVRNVHYQFYKNIFSYICNLGSLRKRREKLHNHKEGAGYNDSFGAEPEKKGDSNQ